MVEWKELTKKEREFIEKVDKTNAGKRMLERVAKSTGTKLQYSKASLFLSEFLNKPIDDLVNEYITDVKASMYEATDKWEETFKEFTTWLENKGYKSASVALYHAGALALINANVPRSMRLKAETPEYVSRTIPGVTIEDLKEIYAMCDERERTFIAILKDSGISKEDALTLNYGDVKGFEKDDFIHINMYRGKEHVEYETFIGPNATDALRGYTTIRRNKGEVIDEDTPIFASIKEPYERLDSDGLTMIFWRIRRRTKKVISTHRLRKFFETYMALTVRHPIVLKYWVGHKVKTGRDVEARYIIPPTPEQLNLYKDSYKNIDLTQAGMEERVKAVEKILEGMTPEQKELMQRHGIRLGRRRERNGGTPCKDGIHCAQALTFKQVNESELLSYLQEGWSIAHVLQSGDVIVKR